MLTNNVIQWAARRPDLISCKPRLAPPLVKFKAAVPVSAQKPNKQGCRDSFVTPFLRAVLRAVCRHYGVTRYRVKSRRRTNDVFLPRLVYYALGRELTPAGLRQVGELVGRDHGTVMKSLQSMKLVSESELETARCAARREIRKIKQIAA